MESQYLDLLRLNIYTTPVIVGNYVYQFTQEVNLINPDTDRKITNVSYHKKDQPDDIKQSNDIKIINLFLIASFMQEQGQEIFIDLDNKKIF